jgi:phospholipase C
MRFIVLVVCLAATSSVQAGAVGKIKHVIALMLENRSFDHMLGFLKKFNTIIKGCLPNENDCSNPTDPTVANSLTYTVDDSAIYVQVSPHHSISWTTEQIYGFPNGETPPENSLPSMNGFIKAYADSNEDQTKGIGIMQCFAPEHVPIISTLATEFALFDGWFASIPGPTMVNRAYAASGTSYGMGTVRTSSFYLLSTIIQLFFHPKFLKALY